MSVKQDLIDGEIWAAEQRRKMGAKNFDEWVKSLVIYKYTPFKSNDEVKKYVTMAGYDLKIIQTNKYIYVKTHLKNDEVYWIFENGKIVASFSSDIDKRIMNKFISDIEAVFGQKCFFDKQITTNSIQRTFPTIYTDTNILRKALKELHFNVRENQNGFTFELKAYTVTLKFNSNSPYDFIVKGYGDLKEIHEYFNMLETSYQKVSQENICNNIKSKLAKSSKMHLEQEEILEDNSVLLTISI